MRRIRELLLACGLVAAMAGDSTAQDPTARTANGFGPIPIANGSWNSSRPLAVYRKPYEGPMNRHLDKLGEKMRAIGMHGGATPLYVPAAGSGIGLYGFGYGNSGLTSPLYHPVGSSTEPSPFYDPVFSSLAGTPSAATADKGWTYSPPWSKAYRQGESRKHKFFAPLHQDTD
jgi:hypothetical protein